MSCRELQSRLSEYIDSALGAKEMWEVEKHLAVCRDCSRALGKLRRTVEVVQAAPRYEVTPDFAEALQQRLATVTPRPARRMWFAGVPELLKPRRPSAWVLGFTATALVLLTFVPRGVPTGSTQVPTAHPVPSREMQAARAESVAFAATNPFDDVASANLAASAPTGDASAAE